MSYEIVELKKIPVNNPKAWAAKVKVIGADWKPVVASLIKDEGDDDWSYIFPADMVNEEIPSGVKVLLKEAIDKITRKGN